MNCPKCGCTRVKYVHGKKKVEIKEKDKHDKETIRKEMKREDNTAKCPKCKWKGVI